MYCSYGEYVVLYVFIIIIALGVRVGLACGTGKIAEGKGMSYAGWWCLSFFLLGVIALIIALCISDRSQPQVIYVKEQKVSPKNDAETSDSLWKCPKCGELNRKDFHFCSYCGAKKEEPKEK